MTLRELESAVRPQFVWEDHPSRRWYTKDEIEFDARLGIIAFCGIAALYGFKEKELKLYLQENVDMTFHKVMITIRRFDKLILEGRMALIEQQMLEERKIGVRLLLKSRLVQNYIKLNYNRNQWVKIADLEY